MKCIYCRKEINEINEKYHVLTLDGDFIHDDCQASWELQKSKYDYSIDLDKFNELEDYDMFGNN